MSPRALKACPGCGTPTRTTPCPTCTPPKAPGRHTRSAAARGYDHHWRRLRAQAIRRQPWCADCGLEGTPDGTTTQPGNPLTGDHNIPLSAAPERRLDPKNIVVRCLRCNSRKADS